MIWSHITVANIKCFMGPTIINSDLIRKIIKNLEEYPVSKFRNFSFSGVVVCYQINLTVASPLCLTVTPTGLHFL